jgi:hypothetical protein
LFFRSRGLSLERVANVDKIARQKAKRHGDESVAFCLTAREIATTSRSSFRPEANPTRQLTGLRPKPEQQPKQQRPKRQRLRPKQQPKPKQQSRSQQQQHPKQPLLRPKLQQPVPKQQLRR